MRHHRSDDIGQEEGYDEEDSKVHPSQGRQQRWRVGHAMRLPLGLRPFTT